jgi:hypothetical protein
MLAQDKFCRLPKELQQPVILVDMPTDGATMEQLAAFAHLYTTSGSNPDVPTKEVLDNEAKMSNEQILQAYVDKQKNPEQFAFTLDVIENPVEDSVKRLKERLGIKDPDRTVQAAPSAEINLEGGDEEEVLAEEKA